MMHTNDSKARSRRLTGHVLLLAAGLGLAPLAKKAALTAGVAPLPLALATASLTARLLLGERLRPLTWTVILGMTLGLLAMNGQQGGLRLGPPFRMLLATLPLIGLPDVYARRTLRDADPGFVTMGRWVSGAFAPALVQRPAVAWHRPRGGRRHASGAGRKRLPD